MKAIYINLDPYLAAFAAWIKGGKSGPAPTFEPLPLAVTVPLGESAAFLMQTGTFADGELNIYPWGDYDLGWNVTATNVSDVSDDSYPGEGTGGETDVGVGFSSVLQSQKCYWGHVPSTANTVTGNVAILTAEGENFATIPITVLVRREKASGPVDLVDFTPPAAAIAAGTDIKGATFDGNEIVAAETTGALSAPAGA